jgi:hypothetical protein
MTYSVAVQFHFWEYIIRNQTFKMIYHLPVICRVAGVANSNDNIKM